MDKPVYIIALLAALGVLVVGGVALAISRTTVHLPLPQADLSPFASRVSLHSLQNKEYLTLSIVGSYSDPIRISGWTLENGKTSIELPEGTLLLRQGVVNTKQPIALYPGEEAVISFRSSPVGVSFHVNTCSPLLEKFQQFTPPLTSSVSTSTDGFYNDCVLAHERDANFYTGQWRIFAGTPSLFNNEHGAITLRDENKLPIATLAY